jgi:ATP-dependent protease ClpP protease subunit
MAKELYLYSGVYDFVAQELISQMEENKSEDITIRVNSPGGSVFAGWGIIAKMKEHGTPVNVKVDGVAASFSAYLPVFSDYVECLDVSRIHLHRADGFVNSPEQQEFLDSVNKDLKAKLAARIDAAKLKELKGVTIEDLFDPDQRIEVWLTAKEAKAIRLVNKIVKLNPSQITAYSNLMKIAASIDADGGSPTEKKPIPTKHVMKTLEELKAAHPELYAQAISEGKAFGSAEERDRIRGWEAFRNIDAAAVDAGIKSGKAISGAEIAELSAKAVSPEALKKLTASSAAPLRTDEETPLAEKTETEKELAALEASVRKSVGLKTKTI